MIWDRLEWPCWFQERSIFLCFARHTMAIKTMERFSKKYSLHWLLDSRRSRRRLVGLLLFLTKAITQNKLQTDWCRRRHLLRWRLGFILFLKFNTGSKLKIWNHRDRRKPVPGYKSYFSLIAPGPVLAEIRACSAYSCGKSLSQTTIFWNLYGTFFYFSDFLLFWNLSLTYRFN